MRTKGNMLRMVEGKAVGSMSGVGAGMRCQDLIAGTEDHSPASGSVFDRQTSNFTFFGEVSAI